MATRVALKRVSSWAVVKRLNFFPGFNDLPMPDSASDLAQMLDEAHATNIAHIVYMILLPAAVVYSVLGAPQQVAYACMRPYSELSAADFPYDLATVTRVMHRALVTGISAWHFIALEPSDGPLVVWDYPDTLLQTRQQCPPGGVPCHVFNVTSVRVECDEVSGTCSMTPLNQDRPVLSGAACDDAAAGTCLGFWERARPDFPLYVVPAPFDSYRACAPSEWQLKLSATLATYYFCVPPAHVGVYGSGYNLSPLNMGVTYFARNNIYNVSEYGCASVVRHRLPLPRRGRKSRMPMITRT